MKTKNLDVWGLGAATLCLIHCLVFPLLVIIPLGIAHNPFIDLAFLVAGTLIVKRVTRTVDSFGLKLTFWAAIALIGISVFSDLLFHVHLPLIYIGSVLLIIAHIINFRKHKH